MYLECHGHISGNTPSSNTKIFALYLSGNWSGAPNFHLECLLKVSGTSLTTLYNKTINHSFGRLKIHLAENIIVYALLVPGRMALPTILCSIAFIFVMSLFGRRYPALSGLMPSYLVVRRQGFGSHILVTQDPLCDLSLVG